MPYKLVNPKVLSNGKKFKSICTKDSSSQSAKLFFKKIIAHAENEGHVNLLISLQKVDNKGKNIGPLKHFSMKRSSLVEKNSNNNLKKVKAKISCSKFVPGKSKFSKSKLLKGGKRKSKRRKSKKKESSTSSDSEYVVKFHSNVISPYYYLYNPFIYDDYLYSTYILEKNLAIPNLLYNLSPIFVVPH